MMTGIKDNGDSLDKGSLSASNNEYFDVQFERLQLSGESFNKICFDRCQFTQCDFSQCQFSSCQFVDCEFFKCNLSSVELNSSGFSDTVFEESKVIGVNWTRVHWPQVKLTSPIAFYRCNISYSTFMGLSLNEIVMEGCKAESVDFRESNLSHANLAYTHFSGSQFVHTNLTKADFTEAMDYQINPNENEITQAIFSFPEVVSLLNFFDITINGITEPDSEG